MITRICVIGGGPAGLALLKILQETSEYQTGLWDLVAFEEREDLGGVWLPAPPVGNPPATPLYDVLTTNLPHPLMAYSSFWFEPSTPLFPHARHVLKYLQAYATHFDLRKYIQFNTRVDEVIWDVDKHRWNVRLAVANDDRTVEQFDKIIVANGHYRVPKYPTIPGLRSWIDAGKASHSVYYRDARSYHGQTILVIGNGPSGQDISADVSLVAKVVYRSITAGTPEDIGNVKRRGRVLEFLGVNQGAVIFENDSISGIDHVILATGYVMSYPFLPQVRSASLPAVPPLPNHVMNTTYGVFPLARHIFPLQDDFPADSIAFVGLPIRVAPFPIFEVQGRYIARAFGNPAFLKIDKDDAIKEIIERYDQLRERFGGDTTMIAKEWHIMPNLEQFSYRRRLLSLAGEKERWFPEDWEAEMYSVKGELRVAWRTLERNGEADEWVEGIGGGGRHEWVDMMRRLLAQST